MRERSKSTTTSDSRSTPLPGQVPDDLGRIIGPRLGKPFSTDNSEWGWTRSNRVWSVVHRKMGWGKTSTKTCGVLETVNLIVRFCRRLLVSLFRNDPQPLKPLRQVNGGLNNFGGASEGDLFCSIFFPVLRRLPMFSNKKLKQIVRGLYPSTKTFFYVHR